MSEVKVTKLEMFVAIAGVLSEAGYDEYVEAVEKEIAALDRKAEKAKERAAAKAAESDEYKAIVAGALTDEFQTGTAIFELVGDEDLTLGKVRARLTSLVKDGSAVKEEVKVGDKKAMAYRLA